MKRAGFIDTWRDFGRGTKVSFVAMVILGFVVFVVGTYADLWHPDWLQSYSYLPNIMAGITGFLVGVPVALVGLSTISGQREEKAASDRVQTLTRLAWNQYRDAIYDLCGEQRIEAMKFLARAIQDYHDQTLT